MSQRKLPITRLALCLCNIILGTFITKLAEYTENLKKKKQGQKLIKIYQKQWVHTNPDLGKIWEGNASSFFHLCIHKHEQEHVTIEHGSPLQPRDAWY